MSLNASDYIRNYNMQSHPEGGYYCETWRSPALVKTDAFPNFQPGGERNLLTSILFLLPGNSFSALHRIAGEELWNYHTGDPVIIFEIIDGQWKETRLGPGDGETLQHMVLPGTWFGSRCANPEGFSLCGCTVVPGFDFKDFEMAGLAALNKNYPALSGKIAKYTRLP